VPGSTISLRRQRLIAAFLFAIVFCVFLPCLWNDFSNFDDPVYIKWNGHIRAGLTWKTVWWAFSTFYAANWHPLTWISHMIDIQFFDGRAWGHHLTSFLFHSANVALLFLFLSSATGLVWRSAVVAILFGVHPLHVESVAWIAERKDVLNTFFALLTLLAYVRWTRQRQFIWYWVGVGFFALSLMSKAMSVTLPILLLLLDYWPLGRIRSVKALRNLLIEKIPFLVLSAAASAVTIAAQGSGGAIKIAPLWVRSANAMVSIARYLGKLFWPRDLAAFYPYAIPTAAAIVSCTALVVAISAAAIVWRRTLPSFFVGWLWFVITLVPVIGLIQIGTQAMADRYMYLPSIGPFVAVAWVVADLSKRIRWRRPTLASATCLAVVALIALTEKQIAFWKNGETLFRHALAVTNDNPMAELNLGVALGDRGALSEALPHLREAVRLSPNDPECHVNLGLALDKDGKRLEAISEFETAIQLKPDFARGHANLAIALQEENDLGQAITEYQEALRFDPISPDVRVGLGLALQRSGQIDAALVQFEEAIKEDPSYAGAHSNRGIVLEKLGRLDEALAEYRKALSLDSKNSDASLNLPVVLFKTGRVEEAIAQVRELIKRRPDYAEAYFNLGGMLYSKADLDGAIGAYQHALKLKPDYADARHNLNVALEDKAAKSR